VAVIAWLAGTCREIGGDGVVIDVQGVGYEVRLPERDRIVARAGERIELRVHTEVREDAIELYGFTDAAGRELFRLLLSVSGVGPKGAMALLSALEPGELALAVRDERHATLTRAKGIGKKTAELICLKLRDRLPPDLVVGPRSSTAAGAMPRHPAARDVLSALHNLGYKPAAADQAMRSALDTGATPPDFDGLLRATLALLKRPG
jgi:Holliday junction DNA helicase RuvA